MDPKGWLYRRVLAGALVTTVLVGGIVGSAGAAHALSVPSASLVQLVANASTTAPGAFDLPVGPLPSQAFQTANSSTPSPVESIGVGHTGVGHTGVGHTGVGHTGVGHTGLGTLNLGGLGVGHTGVGHTDIVGAALQNVLLTDLPVVYPHGCDASASTTACTGWDGILSGTGLEVLPRQTVTMKDVVLNATALQRFDTLQLSDVDLSHTPLTNLPLAGVLLAGVPISHLSIDGNPDLAHTFQTWCATLAGLGTGLSVDCLTDLGVDPTTITDANVASADTITLLTIAFAGVDFSLLPLSSVTVTGDTQNPTNVLGTSPLGIAKVGTANVAGFSPDMTLDDIGVGHTGVGHTGVGHTGVGHTGVGHTGVGHTDIAGLGVGHTGVGHTDLNSAGVGHTGVGHTGVGHTGVGHTAVGASGPGAVPLGMIVLGDTGGPIGIGTFRLADLNLTPGTLGTGCAAIPTDAGCTQPSGLAGVALSDLATPAAVVQCADPTNSIAGVDCLNPGTATLADASAQGYVSTTATVFDLATALTATSPSASSFGAIPSGQLIGALLPGSTEGNTVTFADYIRQINAFSVTTLDTPPYQMTLAQLFQQAEQIPGTDWTVGAGGIDSSSTTLNVAGSVVAPAAPFTVYVDAELLNVVATVGNGDGTQTWTVARGVNGSTAVAHPAGVPVFGGLDVELSVLLAGLSVSQQDATTLDELFGALPPDVLNSTNLGELLSVLAAQTGVTLDDLLLALLGQQDLPWEQLDLGSVNLQSYAPSPTLLTYTGAIAVTDDGGGSLQDVVATATIPADFAYVPGSAKVGAGAIADPAISNTGSGQQLTFSLAGLPAGTYSLVFQLEPGVALGTESVSAEAHLASTGSPGTPQGADVTINNVTPNAASADPASPTSLTPNDLYLGHISAGQRSNFYRVTVLGGQRVSLLLANLPADYDLIMYDLDGASHLRGTASGSVIPVSDPAPSLSPAQETLPPETLQDLPLVAGKRVYDVSANRGLKDEEIDSGTLPPGDYLVQVAAYNATSSDLPYSLRARVVSDPQATCPTTPSSYPVAPAYSGAVATAPVDTLVLFDPSRFANTWGGPALTQVYGAIDSFMQSYHGAQLVDVETDPATAAAYHAWDSDPCSIDGANSVVKAIGGQIDALIAANPNLKFVTIVGSDDQIPMGRVRDATRIANERGRASDFADAQNAYASAFSGGFLFSDDVFAQQHPLAVGGRDLFVPDLQVGRLVDQPGEIAKSFTDFANASGTLPGSARSLVTGYDFLKDGAQAVQSGLQANHNPTPLINDTWTRDDLAQKLLGAPSAGATSDPVNYPNIPNIASVNAHFDEQNILPAIGNTDKSRSALFTVADAQASATRNGGSTLQGTLLFSMGCHSGLNLPDAMAAAMGRTGNTQDWAQFMAQQGALWIANTGFGYGDTDTVALSEKLMSLLADQLDRSGTVGEALRIAKQRYLQALSVVSPYDEKVLEESTFYGLPMWSLGSPTKSALQLSAPSGSSPDAIGGGLRSTDFVHDFDPNGVGGLGVDPLNLVVNPNASNAGHYEDNGQVLDSPQRPLQPRYEFDASPSRTDAANLDGMVAKGALITELHSTDNVGFLPDYSRPAVDQSQNEVSQPVGDASFPAGLQSLTTFGRGAGLSQHVDFVPAQFRPTPGLADPGRGTERIFTHFRAHVYYGSASSTDSIAPEILASGAQVFNNTVTVTAQVQDAGATDPVGNVKRVLALVSQAGTSAGTWAAVELHPSASLSDPPGTWVGTLGGLASPTNLVDYYLQAVDAAGNVGASASKGAYFNAQNLAPTGPLSFTFTGTQGLNGWYTSAVSVKIKAPAVTSTRRISYSIDGAKAISAPVGPVTLAFTDTTEGVHTIVAYQAGQQQSRAEVLIDRRAPVPDIGSVAGSTASAAGWFNDDPHIVTLLPLDPGSFGSGVATITYSATGASPIPSTTVPEPPVGSPPARTTITADGITTLVLSAADRAGNVAIPPTPFPIGVDSIAPTASIAADPVENAAHWHNAVPALTITAHDNGPSSAGLHIVYTVNGQFPQTAPTDGAPVQVGAGINPPDSTLTAAVDPNLLSEGHNVIVFSVTDNAGNSSGSTTVSANVDGTPPVTAATVNPALPSSGWEKQNTTVTFTGVDPILADRSNPSGVASITWSAAPDALKGGATVASTTAINPVPDGLTPYSTSYQLTSEGITTFTYASADSAGNAEVTHTRTVKLDKTPPVIPLCQPADALWHAADVSRACTASDAMSGLAIPADASFSVSTNLPVNTESANVSTATHQVCDVAGNCATSVAVTGNKIDKRPPAINLSLSSTNASAPVGPQAIDPASGAPIPVYILGQVALAGYTCPDGGSGTKSCLGTNDATTLPTAFLNTGTVGMHTFTVKGTDNVGNVASKTYKYRIVYNICPQYDVGDAKAIGATVAVKVKLCRIDGDTVIGTGVTLTGVAANNNSALLSTNSANSPANFVFKYDSTARTFLYNLKTDSRYVKTPNKNYLQYRISTDPVTPAGSASDVNYLNLLYRSYFLLK